MLVHNNKLQGGVVDIIKRWYLIITIFKEIFILIKIINCKKKSNLYKMLICWIGQFLKAMQVI